MKKLKPKLLKAFKSDFADQFLIGVLFNSKHAKSALCVKQGNIGFPLNDMQMTILSQDAQWLLTYREKND